MCACGVYCRGNASVGGQEIDRVSCLHALGEIQPYTFREILCCSGAIRQCPADYCQNLIGDRRRERRRGRIEKQAANKSRWSTCG